MLTGFAIIGVVILAGYVIGRTGIGGPGAGFVLNRVAFFVATPALLFTIMAHADIGILASPFFRVSVLAIVTAAVLYLAVGVFVLHQKLPELTLATASSSYVNANNIGLPVAIYVLGDPVYVAPVLLIQLLFMAPTALALLDISVTGNASFRSIITQPVRNPMIIASLLGVLVSLFGIPLPDAVLAPLDLIGQAAIPMVLMAFGISLHGQKPLRAGSGRKQVLTASFIKVVLMPVAAYLLGEFVFHLPPDDLFAAVAVAALPTAQNIYNFSARYERGEVPARDTVLLTTVASVPAMFLIAALLAVHR